jgi:hypothetical protein
VLLVKNKRFTSLYVLLIVVYIAQTLTTAVNPSVLTKYRIDTTQVRLLSLTIALPYIVIWFIGLVGYLRLQNYGELIGRREKDGMAFTMIAHGVLGLGLWLPLSTIATALSSQYYLSHPSATANLVRFNNYFNLIIVFVGIWFIYKGSEKLLTVIKKQKTFVMSPPFMYAYLICAGIYVYLTFLDPARQFPTHTVAVASYYEPDWLLLLTLVIPRLIYGFLGVVAVYNIHLYNSKVQGSLYKQALKHLTQGLIAVIAITMVLRCLASLTTTLEKFGLQLLLAIIYILLVLIAVGYILIARGAKQLQNLEEL